MRSHTNRKPVFDATIMAGFNADVNRALFESTSGVRELMRVAQKNQIDSVVAGFNTDVNRALFESTSGVRELMRVAQKGQIDSIARVAALAREMSPAHIFQRSYAAWGQPTTEELEDDPEPHQHNEGPEEYLPWAIS